MSGEFEAAGDIVTGGAIARAIEPRHGEAHHGDHGDACLNCGAALTGEYCAQCGQQAHVHRSFAAIGHDLLHGVLHLDGKIFRTLPELALRPGTLTRRYIRGERAKFVSPFALFLFTAFLMYAVFSLVGHDATPVEVSNEQAVEEIAAEQQKARETLADIEKKLAEPGISENRRAMLREDASDARNEITAVRIAGGIAGTAEGGGLAAAFGKARNDPEFAYYKLKANAYKFSWALILISIPFVWLLFPFSRKYKMYDHAVYATYSISFMSLLFSVQMVANGLGLLGGLASAGLVLFAAWHMYRQMKDAYGLSRTGALLRLPLLYGFAAAALGIFYGLLVAVS